MQDFLHVHSAPLFFIMTLAHRRTSEKNGTVRGSVGMADEEESDFDDYFEYKFGSVERYKGYENYLCK